MTKFKVGDWVKVRGSIYKLDFCDVLRFKDEEIELWQPQVGEWCWFYSSGMETPFFGRLKALVLISQTSGYLAEEQPFKPYTQCEPFIGTLPSFLQGL